MDEINTTYEKNGRWIDKKIDTTSENNSPAVVPNKSPYIHLRINVDKDEIKNNSSDSVTVTIETVDGMEICQGTELTNASVLKHNGTANIRINEKVTTKEISDGILSFSLKTDKPTGTSINIVAESLLDDPAESDSTTIEVVSA